MQVIIRNNENKKTVRKVTCIGLRNTYSDMYDTKKKRKKEM